MPRGHIRQRSTKYKDSWTVYLYLGIDPDSGKKRYKTEVVRGTKRDAQKRLTELLRQLDTGDYVEPSKERVEDFLRQWLRDYAETHVRQRTLEGYRLRLEHHVMPTLGNVEVDKLNARQVQSLESALLRKGLSATTVLNVHRVLSQALRWGVRMGRLSRNVAEAVEPPHPSRYEATVLDWDDVNNFLDAARHSRYYPLFLTAILTGLRRSEMLALRWQDVDLDNATLSVIRGLVKLQGGKVVIAPPKSGKARVVHLPQSVVFCLKELREVQESIAEALRQPFLKDRLIFCQSDGKPLTPNLVSRTFREIARKAGLDGVRFHDLRHTHASLMLAEGVHLKVVSERLGHATIGITGDLYSHVMPSLQRDAIEKIDRAFEHRRFTKDLQRTNITEDIS